MTTQHWLLAAWILVIGALVYGVNLTPWTEATRSGAITAITILGSGEVIVNLIGNRDIVRRAESLERRYETAERENTQLHYRID